MPRFLAVCLNPTFQRTVSLKKLDVGEVNRATEARLDAAGKGVHVARVLAQLGGEAVHLTHLGPGRDAFLDMCDTDGFTVRWEDSSSPIRTCITLLDGSDNSTTEVIEPTETVDEQTVERINKAFSEELVRTDMLVLSGSKAPGYPPTLFADWCRAAAEADVPVICDYRGEELTASLPFLPAVVKINLVEFCSTFLPGLEVSEADDTAALPAAREKLVELSASGTDWVITRGGREILCCSRGELSVCPPQKLVPVNTIGSGDSVTAGLALELASGSDLLPAVKRGVLCGAQNAMRLRPGTIV